MISQLSLIEQSIEKILKDGKVDLSDIPEIVLLITELISTSSLIPSSTEDLEMKVNETYIYVMEKYNLYPDSAVQREAFDKLFRSSMKLVLFQPIIKSKCDRFWSQCFTQKGR